MPDLRSTTLKHCRLFQSDKQRESSPTHREVGVQRAQGEDTIEDVLRCQSSRFSSAFKTARVRSRTYSFERMLETCFLMVRSATKTQRAISRFEQPAAITTST